MRFQLVFKVFLAITLMVQTLGWPTGWIGVRMPAASAALINALTNGGFETGDLTGWDNPLGVVVTTTTPLAGAHRLSAWGAANVEQRFRTVAGQSYTVTLQLRLDDVVTPATWGGMKVSVLNDSWAELNAQLLTPNDLPLGQWVPVSFTFVADGAFARLKFQRFSDGSFVVSADEFGVWGEGTPPTPTPAPPTATPLPVINAPMLLVVNSAYTANPFGNYLGELLRAEGLNFFQTRELADLTATDITGRALVVLAETSLSSAQADLFTQYVTNGGRLLALRPDAALLPLFGLSASAGALPTGYIKINTASAIGAGLPGQPLQIHTPIDRYATSGQVLATLYSSANTPTAYPVMVRQGEAIAFTFDVARNVALLRQGNPANINLDVDGDGVTRTIDLFQSPTGSWVDLDLVPIPQADEQQRLLARAVRALLPQPAPQWWYFPNAAKTMLIITSDSHANPHNDFVRFFNSLNARNAKSSVYLSIGSGLDTLDALMYEAQGHSLGLHPYTVRPDTYQTYAIANLDEGYTKQTNWFNTNFSGAVLGDTSRIHRVEWRGWTEAAEIGVAHGMRLTTDFYHWGPWLQKPDGSWPMGYITGSGQTMKMVRTDGAVLPFYQQVTQLVDEQLIAGINSGGFEGLGAYAAFTESKTLIDASLAGDYAALMTQFHIDYYSGDAQFWAELLMDYANVRGVPMWSADTWVDFVDARNQANFADVNWDDATRTLTFAAPALDTYTSTLMLPAQFGAHSLSALLVNGSSVAPTYHTIKGEQVAFLNLNGAANIQAVYAGVVMPTLTPTPAATPTSAPSATSVPSVTPTATPSATPIVSGANRQPWAHVPGTCSPTLQGAVFGIAGSGCGGTGTTFDARQIYAPTVLKDVASAAAPCVGIAHGDTCYRMWYVGEDTADVPRIGYATSPDGVTWTRVPGAQTGGSVLAEGPTGAFDSRGAAYLSVVKDGNTFLMWYTGYSGTHGLDYAEGIGLATSTNGTTWTRIPGPLAGGAVLRASGVPGQFDADEAYVPFVIKDVATTAAPCVGIPVGNTCYRMWYEGATWDGGYRFLIGYATSPDGLTWTRVPGSETAGAALGQGTGFDANSVGIAYVVKDGALFRMWYEAKDWNETYAIGHAVSADGINWVRPNPNVPVYTGADDPGFFTPDNLWSHAFIKDGLTYKMWYGLSTQPDSVRIGYAEMLPGAALPAAPTLTQAGNTLTLTFTTAQALPAGSSVLVAVPAGAGGLVAGNAQGFGPGATLGVDAHALTDAPAFNAARAALVVRLPNGAPIGLKTLTFSINTLPAEAGALTVQTFDVREVVEHGQVALAGSGPTPTATSTPTVGPSPTPTSTFTPSPTATPSNTPSPTLTPTASPTAAPVTNRLANGGFETGSLSSWEDNGGISVVNGAAYAGSFGARLTNSGRIDQVFATTNGQTYYVAARLRLNQQITAPGWGGLRLQAVNSSWQQLATSPSYNASNAPLGQWVWVTFSFVANTSSTRLIYQNFSGGGQFVADLDDVVVSTTAIPDATPTPTAVPSATATATSTATASNTPTATSTPTVGPSPTPTHTFTPSPTATPSNTPNPTQPPTASPTAAPVTNRLTNGGFETGNLSSWEDNGGISVMNGAAYAGSFGARLTNSGRIDQVFATTNGQTYYVAARLRLNQQITAPGWGGLRLQAVNSSWQQLATSPSYNASNAPLGQWVWVTFSFVANTSSTRLIYQNFSGGGQFVADLDDVVVSTTAIPDATPTPTAIPSATATASNTPTATSTPTVGPSPTPTHTFTPSPTATPSNTPSPTQTPTASPTAAPVTNRLTNGGFETGNLSAWEDYGGMTVLNSAAYAGNFGARINASGRIDQNVDTVIGQTYRVTARLRLNQQVTTPSWGGLRLQAVNSNWQQLATSPSYNASNAPLGQWLEVTFTFTANTTRTRLIYQNFSGGGQFDADIDDITLTVGP